MGLLITSVVFFAILLVTAIGFGITVEHRNRSKKGFLTIALTPLIFVILLFGSFTKVNANEVGIIYHDQYGVLETVKYEGFQTKSIFEHITTISTTNKTAYLEVAGQTKDSIYAVFQITVVYRIDAVNAGNFYKKVGSTNIDSTQLNSLTKEALQSATINYDVYGILGDQLEAVRQEFVSNLTDLMMSRYFITVVSASFDDIDAGAQIEQAIQDKAEALQQIEIAQAEQQKAEVEAATALIKANNAAQVVLISAEAQAEAQIILNSVTVNAINQMYLGQFAEGEDTSTPAVYGYLTIQEISDIILKQLYYDTWDGTLPTVVTDGTGIIIQP